MSTANFAGGGGTITRIAPHATGHTWARGWHPAARRLLSTSFGMVVSSIIQADQEIGVDRL
jgi:hypothetical protein